MSAPMRISLRAGERVYINGAVLRADRKLTIELSAEARDWLADKGYEPAYGARPLKRAIQKSLQDPLAEKILAGEIKDGEKVRVGVSGAALSFDTKVKAAKAA